MKVSVKGDYAARRRAEMPPIGEQLDALWKAIATIKALPPETTEMLERIAAVKSKFPKRPNT
jgi:hypothetical protein